jgi:hypothetical protein
LSGVGYTIVPRLSYETSTALEHGHGMDVKLCMLQTSCIPTSPRSWLEIFFYQCLGWPWDTTSRQLKRGNQPPWYNAAGLESVSEHDLEQDADDMPMERDPRLELQFGKVYH